MIIKNPNEYQSFWDYVNNLRNYVNWCKLEMGTDNSIHEKPFEVTTVLGQQIRFVDLN